MDIMTGIVLTAFIIGACTLLMHFFPKTEIEDSEELKEANAKLEGSEQYIERLSKYSDCLEAELRTLQGKFVEICNDKVKKA